jgi:hypothetical protein
MLTYDNVWSFEARDHGFIIPRLKSMLKDVIPGEIYMQDKGIICYLYSVINFSYVYCL